MFGFFTDAVENGIDILDNLVSGETPTKTQVAKLIDAGISVYAISELTGVAEDVIKNLIDD